MADGSERDGLDDNWRDRLVSIGKAAAGALPIPYVGGPLAEIIGVVVPGQRADRIATYLRGLAARIESLSEELRAGLASNAEKIDLIEEGGYQSARATSEVRIEQILETVAGGLAEGDVDVVRRKRLLQILGELDDDEVALLNAYGRSYAAMDRDAFDAVNRPEPTHSQSTRRELDREYLFEAGKAHLLRLGLLVKKYNSVRRGETPEFDTGSGDFKHSIEVSKFGRLFLREIGLKTPFDAEQDDD